jgi:hypothetical protein
MVTPPLLPTPVSFPRKLAILAGLLSVEAFDLPDLAVPRLRLLAA